MQELKMDVAEKERIRNVSSSELPSILYKQCRVSHGNQDPFDPSFQATIVEMRACQILVLGTTAPDRLGGSSSDKSSFVATRMCPPVKALDGEVSGSTIKLLSDASEAAPGSYLYKLDVALSLHR